MSSFAISKFNRWLRSKSGLYTIVGALVMVLLLVFVGTQQGWIGGPGAAVVTPVPPPNFPPPPAGVTCLPTCNDGVAAPQDGKFIAQVGADMASFNQWPNIIWVGVPAHYTDLTIDIFDGDSGLDSSGNVNWARGNWDNLTAESVYTLYADPLKNGSTAVKVGEWRGNALKMPNNGWYSIKFPISKTDSNAIAAQAPSGHYFFRLESTLENPGVGMNGFKLRSNAYLTTGGSDSPLAEGYNAQVALVGRMATPQDIPLVSGYTGSWYFTFPIYQEQDYVEIWNGDFDRGTTSDTDQDTDDPNTSGKPAWSGPAAFDEGVNGAPPGQGSPPDDRQAAPIILRSPAVFYDIVAPAGEPVYIDDNPSGTSEWEKFSMTSNPASYPDADVTDAVPFLPGLYALEINGLDLNNTVWLRVTLCDGLAGCGPRTTEGVCPRPLGYWKDNVESLVKPGNKKVEEPAHSLDKGLKAIAEWSPLFRTGIYIPRPAARPAGTARLSDQEANTILMRGTQNYTYPGDKNSMLAQALQQNLAAWLNLGAGKVGANTYVILTDQGGAVVFQGYVWDALQEAQTIILDPASDNTKLTHAKDIASLLNNGDLGDDATTAACDGIRVPPDQNPPPDQLPRPIPPPQAPPPSPVSECTLLPSDLAGGYAIVAVSTADCQGEQSGLLFHGGSSTTIDGSAFTNGCLRSHSTQTITANKVDYVGPTLGNLSLITVAPTQAGPMAREAWTVAPPDCADPAAYQMNGEDFIGDINLTPGLYCISGDVSMEAGDNLTGAGVTLFFIDGGLQINDSSLMQLSAPAADPSVAPALPGILIYLPETNTQPVQINGAPDSFYRGVVYAPASDIQVLGVGQVYACDSQFIGLDVSVGGAAEITMCKKDNLPPCTAP